ncbi:LOW QUALITY PROTEIN: hypothetical protein V1478_002232 [Vespula squamosa]|uniref:Transmembrane protein n=1 Tax=Vespula squamosa TaxID=30214 RepID=A0ABD2BWJ6_VESSQ
MFFSISMEQINVLNKMRIIWQPKVKLLKIKVSFIVGWYAVAFPAYILLRRTCVTTERVGMIRLARRVSPSFSRRVVDLLIAMKNTTAQDSESVGCSL